MLGPVLPALAQCFKPVSNHLLGAYHHPFCLICRACPSHTAKNPSWESPHHSPASHGPAPTEETRVFRAGCTSLPAKDMLIGTSFASWYEVNAIERYQARTSIPLEGYETCPRPDS